MSEHDYMYEIEDLEIGILTTEIVPSVKMPRERFIEIVKNTLFLGGYQKIADEMLSIANTIPRFPLNTWINGRRGCGCVAGEYLIATSEMTRSAISKMAKYDGQEYTIAYLLKNNPNGEILRKFGEDIDSSIQDELDNYCGWDEWYESPQSVEIIDEVSDDG